MAVGKRIEAAPGKSGTYQPITGGAVNRRSLGSSTDAYGKAGIKPMKEKPMFHLTKTATQKARMRTLV